MYELRCSLPALPHASHGERGQYRSGERTQVGHVAEDLYPRRDRPAAAAADMLSRREARLGGRRHRRGGRLVDAGCRQVTVAGGLAVATVDVAEAQAATAGRPPTIGRAIAQPNLAV